MILRRLMAAIATAAVVLAFTAPGASAESHDYRVAWTQIGIYPRTSPSMSSDRAARAIPDGTLVHIECELEGSPVDNGSGASTVWERLTNGTYLPNAFINTGVDGYTPGIPRCGESEADSRRTGYFRYGAASNAQHWALTPSFIPGGDCTYFVSLSLWDGGGLPETDEWSNDSSDRSKWGSRRLYPGVTVAAINADAFVNYMTTSGTAERREIRWSDNTAAGAELGDVIAYDWESASGRPGADGRIDHLAMVTKFNGDGFPLVSQHTPGQLNRYWSYSESADDWIENAKPGARAYLIHIYD